MRLQIAKSEMSKNIRTRNGARHFVTNITLPKSWPSGWCIGLRSWLRGFDAQLGHLYDACILLPQKSQAAIKCLEIRKKKKKKKKASDFTPYHIKKTLRFWAIWKNGQKIIGGAVAPSRSPVAALLGSGSLNPNFQGSGSPKKAVFTGSRFRFGLGSTPCVRVSVLYPMALGNLAIYHLQKKTPLINNEIIY